MKSHKNITQAAQSVGHYLQKIGAHIVTAESCTGGWLSQAITDIAGSSAWFDRGFITYSNAAKVEMLNVNEQTLATHGAVSAETAQEMTAGALQHSLADYAIAITGIAGPSGGSLDKPIGMVYFSIQKRNKPAFTIVEFFTGNREAVRHQAVYKALQLILETRFN